jgi:hypothetical protein
VPRLRDTSTTELDAPPERDGRNGAAHERPPHQRVSLGAAAARYWWLVALPAVLLAVVGLAFGRAQAATYTAQAQLQVGSIQATAQAVPGYVEATTSLASSYSRVATTDVVLRPAAAALGTSAGALRGRVSATPVPGNPLVLVKAEDGSAVAAERTASAVAGALVAQIRRNQREAGTSRTILRDYRTASERAAGAEDDLVELKAKRKRDKSSVSSWRLRQARGRLDSARLEVQTLAGLYGQAAQRMTAATGIQLLQRPAGAASDRGSTQQKAGFAGLVAGALVGLALAVLLAGRRARR